MSHTSSTCKRRLIYSITCPGWVWVCDWPGVRAKRNHDHDCDQVLGVDEWLDKGQTGNGWQYREAAVSNCPAGCKVYVNVTTGWSILHHNSNYGCTVTANDLRA